MDAAREDEIAEWETERFAGGYDGLHRFAAAEFTGAVAAGEAHLFMLNGSVVGVADGTIEAFEDADGTAFRAPHPSLPLLFAMQERGGETRGQYYTEDTPIEEVDETLSEGGFTGFLELSENVLSGDYYVVYHGGNSMNVAFVGQSRRVLTGEEAFEKADDEVGIYEATAVDLDVVDIPGEPPDPGEEESVPDAVPVDADEPAERPDSADGSEEEPDESPEDDADGVDPLATSSVEPTPADEGRGGGLDGVATGSAEAESGDGAVHDDPEGGARDADEATVRTVPSVDPDRSEVPAEGATTTESDVGGTADAPRLDELESELAERERELAETRERVEAVTGERDDIRAERDSLRERVSELREEVQQLRGEVPGTGDGPSLSVTEARSGTNLFVRYATKSDPTLEDARDGGVELADLRENLEVEHHTQFDEGATVEGRPFEEFLTGTAEYRFLRWLVTDLFFEVRATRNVEAMGKLYDAVPDVDRVELDGTVSVEDEDGERTVGFDLVGRDRMGQPLIVADIDDSRDPLGGERMVDLVEGAEAVSETDDSLAAAFSVTSAFFDPDALETAREATSGSLLSRDKRKSFVKLSRKRGHHLCLVEARDESFHLSVPDL